MSAHDEEPIEGFAQGPEEFVPAAIARTVEEAEALRELLDDHDIPAVLSTQDAVEQGPCPRGRGGVAVLVPEELLDEASEIISEREEMDELDADEDDAFDENEDDELDLQLDSGQSEEEDEELEEDLEEEEEEFDEEEDEEDEDLEEEDEELEEDLEEEEEEFDEEEDEDD